MCLQLGDRPWRRKSKGASVMQITIEKKDGLVILTLMDDEDSFSTEVVMGMDEAKVLQRLLNEAIE